MSIDTSDRIKELHEKAGFTGEPHEQSVDAVAGGSGTLDDGERQEFLQFLRELGVGADGPNGDDDDDDGDGDDLDGDDRDADDSVAA